MAQDLTALNHLLKATSKDVIEKCLNLVFISRLESPSEVTSTIQSILELETEEEALDLYAGLHECIQCVMLTGELESLAELYQEKGSSVNGKLKQLIGQILTQKLEMYKECAAFTRVSMPQLVDVDWAMHMKRASSNVNTMEIPSLLVELHLQNVPETAGQIPTVDKVGFELSKEALQTMLEGLGKIRDQLSSMG